MINNRIKFRNNIKRVRKELGIRQIALVWKSGVAQADISRLERGKPVNISLANARAIARTLGRTVDELFPDPLQEH